ncbi:MAG: alpha/beta hydrolase [Pseudomonadota bacterium]
MFRTFVFAATVSALLSIATCASPVSPHDTQKLMADSREFQARAEALLETEPTPDLTISYTNKNGKTFPINVHQAAGACPTDRRAGLVMFHGGGWKRGEPTQFRRQAKMYNDLGFSVLMPAYSLEQVDGTLPQQALEDALEAWRTIHARAEELCLDVNRLGAGGGSAGGHLAAALATVSAENAPAIGPRPKLLLLFNPVIDNSPDGYGHDRIGADWTWFSPLHNIPDHHPDTLFLLGDQDILIPVSTGEAYCAKIRAGGSNCRLIIYPDAEHGWFNQSGFVDTLTDSARFLQDWLARSYS